MNDFCDQFLLFIFNSGHSKSLYGLGFLINIKEKVIEII